MLTTKAQETQAAFRKFGHTKALCFKSAGLFAVPTSATSRPESARGFREPESFIVRMALRERVGGAPRHRAPLRAETVVGCKHPAEDDVGRLQSRHETARGRKEGFPSDSNSECDLKHGYPHAAMREIQPAQTQSRAGGARSYKKANRLKQLLSKERQTMMKLQERIQLLKTVKKKPSYFAVSALRSSQHARNFRGLLSSTFTLAYSLFENFIQSLKESQRRCAEHQAVLSRQGAKSEPIFTNGPSIDCKAAREEADIRKAITSY